MRLKKLISDKEVKSLINEMINTTGCTVSLLDNNGNVLMGQPAEESWQTQPIKLADKVIGYITGPEISPMFGLLIDILLKKHLEMKALADDTLEKYKEITLLYDAAGKISTCLELDQITKLVKEQATDLVKSSGLSIMLWNKDTNQFDILAAFGTDTALQQTKNPNLGIFDAIFNSRRPEIINNASADPRCSGQHENIKSMMLAPLIVKQENLGVARITCEETVEYTAADLQLFSTLVSQAAIAIQNARLYNDLREGFFGTIQALMEIMETKDPYATGHAKRVMTYSIAVAQNIGLSPAEQAQVKLASLLHDIGKIAIPDEILLKKRELTFKEQQVVQKHAEYGADFLKHVKELRDIVPIVRGHHERYDGFGYPDGLKAEKIPLMSRIIAVSDSYDQMTSDNPVRPGMAPRDAMKEIVRNEGTLYDPAIIKAFEYAVWKNMINK
ncbi:MAG: HD-GYP domain-containing protein [Acidobacteriota bacterium]